MLDQIIKQTKPKMDQVVAHFQNDLKTIHIGRASSALVEDIKINHYNALLPLKQIASISVPDAGLIVINPWDKGALLPIETAIKDSGLNLNPINDGQNIRLALPPASQERRQELAKIVRSKAEEARVAVRSLREDAWKQVVQSEKAGKITQDDRYRGEEELNRTVADINRQVQEIVSGKEREIMSL